MSSDELTQPAGPGVDPLDILANGDVELVGRMPYSSNATFLVTLRQGDDEARAIYKPHRGERPLWDFPSGLYQREVAAYRLSEWMGIHVVPPTVLREDGPLGIGSLQWFIEADFQHHYFTMHEALPDTHDQLKAIAVFDLVANNTDRKSGHCLWTPDGRVWAIDNGLCFSADFKLRTVIWEFGGEPIPDHLVEAVRRLADCVPLEVATLLTDGEVEAITERARLILRHPVLPVDSTGRRYPWPLV